MSNDGPRYQTHHDRTHLCCDNAWVVDTMQLSPWATPLAIAECPDLATAEKIALALNRTADA